jgi:hypothetical protein
METDPRPTVLIIDDEPDNQRALQLALDKTVNCIVFHPEDVTLDDLLRADLVLVDLIIDDWGEREAIKSIALRPLDGVALAAVLRSHVASAGKEKPTAFALHSARLGHISGGLSPESRENIMAETNNLEWVFPKTVPQGGNLTAQISALAHAVRQLPTSWPVEDFDRTRLVVEDLLRLSGEEAWTARAWDDIGSCHPPLHDLHKFPVGQHGLAFLRWFLYRILPYPCFLWDTIKLAARLHVTHRSIGHLLDGDSALNSFIQPYRYLGIPRDFLGPRWWRAGIEGLLWEVTDGTSFDPDAVHSALLKEGITTLEPLSISQPVVCLDRNLRTLEECCAANDAVRIQPDAWPPYADQPWAAIDLVRQEPALRAIVIPQDQERLI